MAELFLFLVLIGIIGLIGKNSPKTGSPSSKYAIVGKGLGRKVKVKGKHGGYLIT